MRFEWDPEKARSNLAKHKVSFDRVEEAFKDPRSITVIDRVGLVTVLFIAHTYEDHGPDEVVVRVISARKADRHEQRSYERGDGDAFR